MAPGSSGVKPVGRTPFRRDGLLSQGPRRGTTLGCVSAHLGRHAKPTLRAAVAAAARTREWRNAPTCNPRTQHGAPSRDTSDARRNPGKTSATGQKQTPFKDQAAVPRARRPTFLSAKGEGMLRVMSRTGRIRLRGDGITEYAPSHRPRAMGCLDYSAIL